MCGAGVRGPRGVPRAAGISGAVSDEIAAEVGADRERAVGVPPAGSVGIVLAIVAIAVVMAVMAPVVGLGVLAVVMTMAAARGAGLVAVVMVARAMLGAGMLASVIAVPIAGALFMRAAMAAAEAEFAGVLVDPAAEQVDEFLLAITAAVAVALGAAVAGPAVGTIRLVSRAAGPFVMPASVLAPAGVVAVSAFVAPLGPVAPVMGRPALAVAAAALGAVMRGRAALVLRLVLVGGGPVRPAAEEGQAPQDDGELQARAHDGASALSLFASDGLGERCPSSQGAHL